MVYGVNTGSPHGWELSPIIASIEAEAMQNLEMSFEEENPFTESENLSLSWDSPLVTQDEEEPKQSNGILDVLIDSWPEMDLSQLDDKDRLKKISQSIRKKNAEALEALLQGQPAALLNSSEEKSPLNQAIEAGFEKGVVLLLKHGSDPTACDGNGDLPLNIAYYENSGNIQELILGGGRFSHTFEKDKNGLNIFDIVIRKERYKSVKPLFQNLLLTIISTHNHSSFEKAMKELESQFDKIVQDDGAGWLFALVDNIKPTKSDPFSLEDPNVGELLDRDRFIRLYATLMTAAATHSSEFQIIDLCEVAFDSQEPLFQGEDNRLFPFVAALIERKLTAVIRMLVDTYQISFFIWDDDEEVNPLQKALIAEADEIAHFILDRFPDLAGWTDCRELNALHYASWKANGSIIKRLLEGGAEINAPSIKGDTPLHLLCLSPNATQELILQFLDAGADPAVANAGKITPLHYICLKDPLAEVIPEFIRQGADPYREDQRGSLPIDYAIRRDFTIERAAGYYFEGANENAYLCSVSEPMAIGGKFKKPIGFKTSRSRRRALTVLLESGVKIVKDLGAIMVHASRISSLELMHLAFESMDETDPEKVKQMLDQAVNSFFKLASSMKINDLKPFLERILLKGGDINAVDREGKTILQREMERFEISQSWVFALIKMGANVNASDPKQSSKTPYTLCLERLGIFGKPEKLGWLRSVMAAYGADVNPPDPIKGTYLHRILEQYHTSPSEMNFRLVCRIVKQVFLAKMCDVARPNRQGTTPLHLLCRIKNLAHLESMVLNCLTSETINLQDNRGMTPYLEACRSSASAEFLKELYRLGGDGRLVPNSGETILHLLACNKNLNYCSEQILEDARRYLLSFDEEGRVPVEIAERSNSYLAVRMMKPFDQEPVVAEYFIQGEEKFSLDAGLSEALELFIASLSGVSFMADHCAPVVEYFAAAGKLALLQDKFLHTLKGSEFDQLLQLIEKKGYREVEKLRLYLSFEVNPAHISPLPEEKEIPKAPDSVSIDELVQLYKEMNRRKGGEYDREMLHVFKFIDCVKSHTPYTGAPSKEKHPEEFHRFYETLENLTKHLIVNLKKCDEETIESHLIDLISTFEECATMWNGDLTNLYQAFEGNPIARTFPEEIYRSLQKMRQGIVETLDSWDSYSSNSHTFNRAKKLIGSFAGIPTPTVHLDPTEELTESYEEMLAASYRRQFIQSYSPARIISHIRNSIAYLYKEEKTREILLQWLSQNVPESFRQEEYSDICAAVSQLENEGRIQELESYLSSLGIILQPGKTVADAIEEDRRGKYKWEAFDLTNEERTTFTHEVIAEILVRLGVLKRFAFAPEEVIKAENVIMAENSRKRKREKSEE